MSRPRNYSASILFLAMIIGVLGCGCNSTAPEPDGVLTGTVTDVAGAPVPGAYINFGYELSFVPIEGNPIEGGARAPHPATVIPRDGRLEVFNHLSSLLRTIEFTAENFDFFWDGKDESGRPVPSGVYRYFFTLYEDDENPEEVLEDWLFLESDPNQRANTWVFQTDEQGQFTVPVELAAVWVDYDLTVSGTGPDDPPKKIVISNSVTIYVFRPGIGQPHAKATVVFEDPKADVSVTLAFPD